MVLWCKAPQVSDNAQTGTADGICGHVKTRKHGSGRRAARLRGIWPARERGRGQGSENAGIGRRAICLRAVYEHTGYVFGSRKRRFRGLPYSWAREVVGLLSIYDYLQNLGVLRGILTDMKLIFEIEKRAKNQSVNLKCQSVKLFH